MTRMAARKTELTKAQLAKIAKASTESLNSLLSDDDKAVPQLYKIEIRKEIARRQQEATAAAQERAQNREQVRVALKRQEAPRPPVSMERKWFITLNEGIYARDGFLSTVPEGTLFQEGQYDERQLRQNGIQFKHVDKVNRTESWDGSEVLT